MRVIKVRAGLLWVLATLVLGLCGATPALATGGPYCHQREVGGKGEGVRIPEGEPEGFGGEGGEQVFIVKILGLSIETTAHSAQIKGILYDGPDQCQGKAVVAYHEIKIARPSTDEGCEVKINSNNTVKLYGYQVWKWNGTKKQLEEAEQQREQAPDGLVLPIELPQGATGLPRDEEHPFATITLSKKGTGECATPIEGAGLFGSGAGELASLGLEVFTTKAEGHVIGGTGQQHFWNGKEFVGVSTGLTFGNEPAKYTGSFSVKTLGTQGHAAEELALFER